MKLFKEIRRRTRNAARALRGEEVSIPLAKMRVNIEPVKVETFAAEQFIGLLVDELVESETVMEHYRRGLVAEIGRKLLEEGVIVEEIIQRPHELGLRGDTMRLSVRVVVPEKEEGAV